MWDRFIFERVRMSSWSLRDCWVDQTTMLCFLSLRQSASRTQCNAITHLFGPKAFVSLGAAIKAPSAWKYGITDDLLQGPVAWPFSERFTSQAVNHTSHSHPFFKCFPAFQSQLLTHNLLLYQFSQPPSPMCHPHLCYCCAVLFPLTSRKMNGTGESWFVWLGFCVLRQRLMRSVLQRETNGF